MRQLPSKTPLLLCTAFCALWSPWAAADDPLPAGYERMFSPSTPRYTFDDVEFAESYADWAGSVSGVVYGSKYLGDRVVDLEIAGYHSAPAPGADDAHDISLIAVPNTGLMECQNWIMALGQNKSGLKQLLNPPPDSLTGEAIPPLRLDDIELYYRKNPYTGKTEATYGFTAVENSGDHYADWEWLPPQPYHELMSKLEASGKRPWDIEFAIDPAGEFVGTALLTDDEGSGSMPVISQWGWYSFWDVYQQMGQGWQVADMELNPLFFPGTYNIEMNEDATPVFWPDHFYILVKPGDVYPSEGNATGVMQPTTIPWIKAAEGFGTEQIIDIEYAGIQWQKEKQQLQNPFIEKNPLFNGSNAIYATVWLFE